MNTHRRFPSMTVRRGIGLVVALFLLGVIVGTERPQQAAPETPPPPKHSVAVHAASAARLSSEFALIASRIRPSVVSIEVTELIDSDAIDDLLQKLNPALPKKPRAIHTLGSGVIVGRGYILTNWHVVKDAVKIRVKLYGDPPVSLGYAARLIGVDAETDLAVIKLSVDRELSAATLGDSNIVAVGDWVLAFGSPFGLDATITAGIISAKNREGIGGQFQRFLQTDAAINPGNSGGPLVNMRGEVVGINTSVMTQTGGSNGVGFALPSNVAREVYDDLLRNGRVARGSIGVSFNEARSANPVALQELGAPCGMIIERVEPKGPAEKAGLRAGDVITTVNGNPVRTGADLVGPITKTPIGRSVRLTYIRNGRMADLSVAVADRAKIFSGLAEQSKIPKKLPTGFGLSLKELPADEARQLGLSGSAVLVEEVEAASFADDLGFAKDDVIVAVNRRHIHAVGGFQSVLSRVKVGRHVFFEVLRRGDRGGSLLKIFLAGTLPPLR